VHFDICRCSLLLRFVAALRLAAAALVLVLVVPLLLLLRTDKLCRSGSRSFCHSLRVRPPKCFHFAASAPCEVQGRPPHTEQHPAHHLPDLPIAEMRRVQQHQQQVGKGVLCSSERRQRNREEQDGKYSIQGHRCHEECSDSHQSRRKKPECLGLVQSWDDEPESGTSHCGRSGRCEDDHYFSADSGRTGQSRPVIPYDSNGLEQ